MTITAEEQRELTRWMEMLAPGYRIYDHHRLMTAGIAAASRKLVRDPAIRLNGQINLARLIRRVITDPAREGYGLPYVWWWIAFEAFLMEGITQDPWSEVKWWIWNEMRGKQSVLTLWGSQNCLAPETLVRMHDGTTKRADLVRSHELLMGDDSTPRKVLTRCAGQASMVRVTPNVGRPFVCTENHILTVVCKRGRKNHGGRGGWSGTATPGKIYDIPAHDLMKMGASRRECYGLISAATEYPERELPCDPYIYGLWLGDGTKTKPELTGMTGPVLNTWENYFRARNFNVKRTAQPNSPKTFRSYVHMPESRGSNPFLNFIRTSVAESKFIRREYLTSSIEQRFELLAGLIDTDGHLAGGVYYTLTSSDPALMDGYEELANSLGFRTSRKTKTTNYRGKSGELHVTETLSICGDIARIPVKMPHKRKIKPTQGRGVRKHGVTGFTLERIGIGDYAGFEVDGNHRFLLADYTISHNSGKSSWGSRFGVCQMAAWRGDAQIYVGGPFKAHTEDKAWAELVTWIKFLKRTAIENEFITALNIGFTQSEEQCTIYDRDDPSNAGTASFVALESASAIQGKKSRRHDESGLLGIMMLLIDEFIENPGLKLKQGEGNIASNYNFFGLLPCNPLPEKVQHPAVLPFSDPIEVNRNNLRRDLNFRWRTAHGLLARFSWQNCPNRILKRTVWPYLLTQMRVDTGSRKGSDIVDSQIDAWGWGIGTKNAPLDEATIRTAGAYNSPETMGGWQSHRTRAMHIDCAFGGNDPATYHIVEAGVATILFGQASVTRKVFACVEQDSMPVDADFRATEEWLAEMEELFEYSGGGFPPLTKVQKIQPGDLMGGAWHLAGQVLRLGRDNDIPPGNICFDSSQRGDCTDVMLSALGRQNVRWWYEGSRQIKDEEGLLRGGWYKWPYNYELNEATGLEEPTLWSKYCSQTISMIWFFACELIRHGYVLNGTQMKKGLDELCARPIVRGRQGQGEGRKDVLGKEKLKDMGIPSPTWGEGIATVLYFATRFLNLIEIEAPKLTTSVAPVLTVESIIRAPGSNRRFSAKAWR